MTGSDDDWEIIRPGETPPPRATTSAPDDNWEIKRPPPVPERTWGDTFSSVGQGAADMARIGSNTAMYGQWDRARAGLDALTSGSKSYDDALKEHVAKTQAARERLGPFLSSTADVVGGVAGGAALARAGGTVVNTGKSIWRRMGEGALEAGAHGGAQAAGHTYSGNPGDYGKNWAMGTLLGAGIGAASPVIAAGAGAASKLVSDRVVPSELGKAAAADREGLLAMLRGDYGPRAMPSDAGPSMLGTTQGAIGGVSSPNKSRLVETFKARDRSVPETVQRSVDEIYGPSPTPSYGAAAKAADMDAMSPAYNAALRGSHRVNTENISNNLTREIGDSAAGDRAAYTRWRRELEIPDNPGTLDPNPTHIHAVRTALRREMRDPANVAMVPVLERIDGIITHELQRSIPGIRALDHRYAEHGTQQRALEPQSPGARIFVNTREQGQRPNEFRDTLAEASQPKGDNVGPSAEGFRLSQAARAEIDRVLGDNANDLQVIKKILATPGDYNPQKLVAAFGQERADRLRGVLDNELRGRDTYQKVWEGSQTEARQAARQAQEASSGKVSGQSTVLGRIEQFGQWAFNKARQHSAESSRDRIAGLLNAHTPAQLQQLIPQLLAAEPTKEARAAIVSELTRQGVISAGSGYAADVPNKRIEVRPNSRRN